MQANLKAALCRSHFVVGVNEGAVEEHRLEDCLMGLQVN